MEFLKIDLQHLFDDQGIDKSQYDDVVEFRDPITQYNNASGTTGLHSEQHAEPAPHCHQRSTATHLLHLQVTCSILAC